MQGVSHDPHHHDHPGHWARIRHARSDATSVKAVSAGASASSSQVLDVSIVTADGDKVTISATSKTRTTYSTYGSVIAGRNYSAEARGASASRSSSSGFAVSVEGELNAAEAKDIVKALSAYESALKDALNGRSRAAQAHANQIGGLDSIASFGATYVLEQNVTVVSQATMATVATTESGPPLPTGAAAAPTLASGPPATRDPAQAA